MKRQKAVLTAILLCFLTGTVFLPTYTYAAPTKQLQATPIPQRFSPADQNGDIGTHNCMPAALTTALTALAHAEPLLLDTDIMTYPRIRQITRTFMPDPRRGISPDILAASTAHVTENAFQLSFVQVPKANWQEFLRQELAKDYPVIVHVSNRYALYIPSSTTNASHVVVVIGMDETTVTFTDSWDGRVHTVSRDIFSRAWGKGHYQWRAFVFIKQPGPDDFTTIIKQRFRKTT
jgi:hypothetical protein